MTPAFTQRVGNVPATIGDESVALRIDAVTIVAAVADQRPGDRPVYARQNEPVVLHAVLRAGSLYFSDAATIELAGRRITPQPLAAGPRVELAWSRIEPAVATLSNTEGGGFRFAPIEYRATPIAGATAPSLVADVRPTLTTDHGDGVGTMRYQLAVTHGARTLATPGVDARRGRGSGGLADAVMRVTVRRDDTFLGYLTEMYGQPYIWASAGTSAATHQSERLEGSDCADLMVYAARRQGKRVAYTWTGGLPAVTTRLAGGARGDGGIYRDHSGKPLPYTRDGDLVLFTRHVGALAGDRGIEGVLDDEDLVIHTLFDTPKSQAIRDTGYAHTPVELRRWR